MRAALLLLMIFSLLFADKKIYEIDSTEYLDGGFQSYPEFINNMPGITDTGIIIKADPKSYDPTDPNYLLWTLNKKGRERPYREKLWGFSKEGRLFIRTSGTALFTDSYHKLTLRKYYSYYSEWNSTSSMATGGGMNEPDVYSRNYFILDMKTGKTTSLTRPILRQLLREKDPELYKYFLSKDGDEVELLEYLEKLNERLASK